MASLSRSELKRLRAWAGLGVVVAWGSGHSNILKNREKTPKNTSISVLINRFRDVFTPFLTQCQSLSVAQPQIFYS
jgi:hypothetical protein